MTTTILLASQGMVTNAVAADKEKCFGVAKAGQNGCQNKHGSCAGTSKVDGQKDAWIIVPKGLCTKLVGGSLSSS